MSWDDFHDRDYRVLFVLDTEMVAELKMYVREKGILTPGSTPAFLKQLLLKREEAMNSLSEIDSEILAFLKPPHSPIAHSFEWRDNTQSQPGPVHRLCTGFGSRLGM